MRTSSTFYDNYSPRDSKGDPLESSIEDTEVQIKKIATKPVKKRSPKAREFQGVVNKKVDVTNAKSRVDTGMRRQATLRLSPLKSKKSQLKEKKSMKQKSPSPSEIAESFDSSDRQSPRLLRQKTTTTKKPLVKKKTKLPSVSQPSEQFEEDYGSSAEDSESQVQ